ncbi:hypothetical protein [Pseudorhodoferax sp.]|uniref:hypothetical protein n=1 Tax=Pseudorhodoferax sp. TaxID=1993553 RepID=UPI002DD6855C|nr:hypothetical protein [Pseudorhodoferax sp.]
MPHPISLLGAVHTLVSLPPIVFGLYGFMRYRAIDPSTRAGKLYLATLALSVLTSFGLSSTGKFNAGHALGILAMAAALGGQQVPRLTFLGPLRPYLSALGLSLSFFLLLVPGINETLNRLPPSHPVGNGIDSPVVQGALKAWVAVFFIGLLAQMWSIHAARRKAAAVGAA